MANPIAAIGAKKFVTKAGRTVYKNARGHFVSYAKYKALRERATGVESYLRSQLGAPPSGMNWFQIASKYAERFADYLSEID